MQLWHTVRVKNIIEDTNKYFVEIVKISARQFVIWKVADKLSHWSWALHLPAPVRDRLAIWYFNAGLSGGKEHFSYRIEVPAEDIGTINPKWLDN